MKKKKTSILIAIVAIVMLAVVGTTTTLASSNTRNEINAADVHDPNYPTFSPEQIAANEAQIAANRKIAAKALEAYEVYGLSYNSDCGQLYYNGEAVKYFADNTATDGSFCGTELSCKDGAIGIIAERNKSGNLTGLKALNMDELSEYQNGGLKTK